MYDSVINICINLLYKYNLSNVYDYYVIKSTIIHE